MSTRSDSIADSVQAHVANRAALSVADRPTTAQPTSPPLGAGEANEILRRLARERPTCYATIASVMTAVSLDVNATIGGSGAPIEHVYFPQSGVLSAVVEMRDGRRVATTIIGREGMIGLEACLGAGRSDALHRTHIAGVAKRLAAHTLRQALVADRGAQEIVQCYTTYVTCQLTHSAACNALHSVAQRCSRWLLMVRDRVGTDTFPLTQQFLASMLGVRRTGVTDAASALRRAGLIRYRRGKITVQDPLGLGLTACECYLADRADQEHMFT